MKIAMTLAALAAGLMTSAASADAILSQPPNSGSPSPSDGVGQVLAENVTPGSNVVVSEITFWGLYGTNTPPATETFEVRVYADNGAGLPMNPPTMTTTVTNLSRTATGATVIGLDEYRFEGTLAMDLPLTGGTTVWVAVVNNTPEDWLWEQSGVGDNSSAFELVGIEWRASSSNRALELCEASTLPACEGEILFVQSPDQSNALFSDIDPAGPDGVPGSGSDEQEIAENVAFTEDVIVKQVRFWGAYAFGETVGNDDDFTLNIYADAGGGVPEETPLMSIPLGVVPRVPTGNLILSQFVEYEYLATLNLGIALHANETYWISIVNNTVNDMDDNWGWAASAQGDAMQAFRNSSAVTWSPDTNNLAFELCGKVCTTAASACVGDLDGNGVVDATDLSLLLGGWGVCPTPAVGSAAAIEDTPRPILPADAHRAQSLTTNR